MAKKQDGEKLVNLSKSTLILPDGTEIPPGAELDLSGDLAENAGVKSWIADGMIGQPASLASQ